MTFFTKLKRLSQRDVVGWVPKYRPTQRADSDLLDIFIFGIEQFGPRQAMACQAELAHSFALLSENPRMGREANTIADGVRRQESGSHVILYE
jgi:toxin ParE1/3/4